MTSWRERLAAGTAAPETQDRRVAAALVLAAVVGVLLDHFSFPGTWESLAPSLSQGPRGALAGRAWQVGSQLLLYVAVPLLFGRAFGLGPARLGLGLGDTRRVLPVAAALFAVAAPAVIALSFAPGFLRTYPLFRPAAREAALLLAWLPLQATLLFSVEFFYRGFLLSMLEPALGRHALWVMLVPYVLTHRDLVEALGAIVVGLIFGLMARASRSIWAGWLTHVSVAFTIELAAVWQLARRYHS